MASIELLIARLEAQGVKKADLRRVLRSNNGWASLVDAVVPLAVLEAVLAAWEGRDRG